MLNVSGPRLERVRFTLLDGGRPLLGRSFTVGAPEDCVLGLVLAFPDPDDDFLTPPRMRGRLGPPDVALTVTDEPGGPVGDALGALMPFASGVHARMRRTAGGAEVPEWAIEAWAASEPGPWSYLCLPWTVCGEPQLECERVPAVSGWGRADSVRFWTARARAGSSPWPESARPVHSSQRVVQVRPDTYGYRALVDLPPPPADVPDPAGDGRR